VTDPWLLLETGLRFKIASKSGKVYETTFLAVGPEDAGLYVRLEDRKLARLSPQRLVWTTLEKGARGAVLLPGDELLLRTAAGEEISGKLLKPPVDEFALRLIGGTTVTVPFASLADGTFRLLFPASDVRAGDDFFVKSRSGNEYRGRAAVIEPDRIAVQLVGKEPGDLVHIQVAKIDLRSLYVLIPLKVTSLDVATVAPAG
jgi:hypothetical protein